jgi:hypothetical protein
MARRENWIKWDLTSRDDPSTKWFLSQYKDKCKAYGFFLFIVELLYQSNDGWLEIDKIFLEGLSSEIGWTTTEIDEAIMKLIEAKLFLLQANRFASRKILKLIEEENNLSNKRSEAGKKGGQNSGVSRKSASQSKQNEANEAEREDKRDKKDKNINNKTLIIPDWILNNSGLTKNLLTWIQQRQQRKKPVSQIALDKNLQAYDQQPERLLAALENSIRNDYQGIFDPPSFKNGSPQKKSNTEKTMEAAESFLRNFGEI